MTLKSKKISTKIFDRKGGAKGKKINEFLQEIFLSSLVTEKKF